MKRKLSKLRIVYLALVALAAIAIYTLIPADVWSTIRETYLDTGAGGP